MWCKKIMVAYDGSEAAKLSLDKAIDMAETCSAEIITLHVATVTSSSEMDNVGAEAMDSSEVRAGALELLGRFRGRQRFIEASGMMPSYVIIDQAAQYRCDLIIMGSRGLTGIKEFLGSVSHGVVQHSPVPVMIVKEN